MTWTYAGDPAASTLAAVRFLIGDTDTNDQQLQDAEINFAIAATSDKYTAAIFCAQSLAAKYSRLCDTAIESVRVSANQQYEHYRGLIGILTTQAAQNSLYGGLGSPYVGGVSISEIENVREDTDRPAAAFSRDKFHNPPSGEQADELFGSG